jgi:tRNA dimethylallyltransferase
VTSQTTIHQEDIERIFVGFAIEAQKQIPESLQKSRKKVIVLAGPTACGKSAFAMSMAQLIGGEIISADSMQVYCGMDIGTAKPTKEDRALVPHHLIDIRKVTDNFNVVDFYYEARQACQVVLGRGGVPIIVGGSGFYIHSLLYGPPSGPPSVSEVRQALEKEMEKLGVETLFERLRQLDPQYASTITKNDKQKIVRALEIIALTGKKVSKLSWKGRRKPQNYDFRCWLLHRPKEHLYQMIDQRCEKMLKEGLLDEVKVLIKNGLLENPSASQAIGYRQAIDFFNSPQSASDYAKCVKSFKQASHDYAKRQLTWFRNKEPDFRWLDIEMHDTEVAIDMIQQDYSSS